MRLYVNIDHVATVREARRTDEPDPVRAAAAAEQGGADGITVHLREDRRHIQDADVRALRAAVRTVLNLELGAAPEIVAIARRLKPFQATVVPERRQEITTEGGLALQGASRKVAEAVRRLMGAGIRGGGPPGRLGGVVGGGAGAGGGGGLGAGGGARGGAGGGAGGRAGGRGGWGGGGGRRGRRGAPGVGGEGEAHLI